MMMMMIARSMGVTVFEFLFCGFANFSNFDVEM
jgi:hypothetical protein